MQSILNSLNVSFFQLSENISLSVLNIEELNAEVKKYIDDSLIDIYSNGSESNLKITKIRLKEYFDSKKDSTLEIGSISEFFIHLYLKIKNFKQDCLYENLEENGIKKGFDGFYTKENEMWIMESKSGSISTKNISHRGKIKEAYDDLSAKLSGKSRKNNPWQNAYFHAKLTNTDTDILKSIQELGEMYTLKKYTKIEDYNIIPSSTIFYDNFDFEYIDLEDLKEKINNFLINKKYNKIKFICINKKTKDLFLKYIQE